MGYCARTFFRWLFHYEKISWLLLIYYKLSEFFFTVFLSDPCRRCGHNHPPPTQATSRSSQLLGLKNYERNTMLTSKYFRLSSTKLRTLDWDHLNVQDPAILMLLPKQWQILQHSLMKSASTTFQTNLELIYLLHFNQELNDAKNYTKENCNKLKIKITLS